MVLAGGGAGVGCKGRVMWGAGLHHEELGLRPVEGLWELMVEFVMGPGPLVPRPGVPRACAERSSGNVREMSRSHVPGKG